MMSISDALTKVFEKTFNFDESVDVAVRLAQGNSAKGTCDLPNATGVGLIIFSHLPVSPNLSSNQKVLTGGDDLVDLISNKKSIIKGHKFSIATPNMMPKIAKIAKILGPRGLMPDAKLGMVLEDVESMAKKIIAGRVFFKSNKGCTINITLGKTSIGLDGVAANASAFLSALKDLRPKNVSWRDYVLNFSISSTMGNGFSVAV
jgi:large subunit ribosomal protein L1